MRKFLLSAVIGAAVAAAPGIAAAADAQPMRDSRERNEAFRGVRQGDILPLHVIRDRISSMLPGATLIGADLVGPIYRLRYMRGANVMIVAVDARTGQPIGCSGC
jgi:hypothetical protein